ncbi:hypothetical protein B0I35DRAFT_478752 [Stachybotrys elegans]|uniref:ABM domain-containing protein n=1 Tax=Stachybotrys elegans TaxID=80388 RepID=A0A8K0SLQ3_9HYPO|nr:hypothetical protein B0I35DRAFT_478752 [Stachybotrys elegans]
MPCTEFALLQLKSGYDELEFLEVLVQGLEVQDRWVRLNQPQAFCSTVTPNVSTMYIQRSDPAYVLLTAPWDSPEAHHEWIQSSDNQLVFGKMSGFLAPGPEATLLFHMNAVGETQYVCEEFAGEKRVNICRMSVDPARKKEVEDRYRGIEAEILRKYGSKPRIWGGWRIETADGEEFVVFWSDKVGEAELQELFSQCEIKERRTVELIVP